MPMRLRLLSLALAVTTWLVSRPTTAQGEKMRFVAHGTRALKGRYPWMANLISATGAHVCGGTLVAPSIVLTAAHCELRDPFQVWVGRVDVSDETEAGTQTPFQVSHPCKSSSSRF